MGPPPDPRLAETIEQLEQTGLAAELFDAQWRYVWLSPQMRALLGGAEDGELGLGLHYLESRTLPIWRSLVTEDMERQWMRQFGPFLAHDTPGGVEALVEMADEHREPVLRDEVEPREAPPVFTTAFEVTQPDLAATTVSYVMVRLRDEEGELLGSVLFYTSPLPATVLALVARGDAAMFGRAAELIEPDRRAAAILFADLEASGALSRRLPSAVYFRLLSELTTKIDADDCRLNVGIHWGGSLYIGQVVTGGRLEVTALGDEMNECARLEQTAGAGQVLASKHVIERLDGDDARAIGLDVQALKYRTLAEIGGASEKALRDAGAIAVTDLAG